MKFLTCSHFTTVFAFILLSVSVIHVCAQEQSADNKLLDEYIASQRDTSTIIFDATNIKQFWIDNTVIAKDGEIVVLLSNQNQKYESSVHKIQLANVDQTLDCKIAVITNDPDLTFSVLDNKTKALSVSKSEVDFIQYHVISSTFHLENATDYFFGLKFTSQKKSKISIKKIVLSFPRNENYLVSPGVLHLGTDDISMYMGSLKETEDKRSISATGKSFRVLSKKKICISDNTLKGSVSVKNTGDKPAHIYYAYAPYTKDGKLIDGRGTLYKKSNQVLKVLSHEKGNNKVVVDSYPEIWKAGCSLALDAKDDLSDFPNTNWIRERIQTINKIDDGHAEILFDKELNTFVEPGTFVRIQAPSQNTYMYPVHQVLEPGEVIKISSEVQRDDSCYEFSAKVFCKGTYYVVPIIMSIPVNADDETSILISDFTVSY